MYSLINYKLQYVVETQIVGSFHNLKEYDTHFTI